MEQLHGLFAAGVPKQIIQSRTGHSSIEALQKYERVSEEQEKAVSKILTGELQEYELAIKGQPATSKSLDPAVLLVIL